MKTNWTYEELTRQAEQSIIEHMQMAKERNDDQAAEWAFGAYMLWFDLTAWSYEFEVEDSLRLRNITLDSKEEGK